MYKVITIFSIFLLLSFGILDNVRAQEQTESNSPEVKVDHLAGRFEKLQEKLTLFFKFNKKDKVRYYQYLSEKRLAELYYVIQTSQIDSVEETASRYSTYIGTLTNFMVSKNVKEDKDSLINMFDRHIKIIEGLQKKFKFESGWWLAIQHDINSAKLFSDKIRQIN